MPHAQAIRSEIQRLIRATSFRRFLLILESGDRVLIEHPENIAFDPEAKRSASDDDFYVITGRIRLSSTKVPFLAAAPAAHGKLIEELASAKRGP